MRWKPFISLLLLIAFAASSFSKMFVVADYYTNTAAYAKNCVNKAKPVLKCNGQCQMMKKLQQQEKEEQQSQGKSISLKNEVLSSKSFYVSSVIEYAFSKKPLYVLQNSGKTLEQPRFCFHPPGA